MKPKPRLWTAPPIWKGGTCFIIGGGPSLRGVNLRPFLTGRKVIAVNDAYGDYHGDTPSSIICREWVPVCFFGDIGWWNMHKGNLRHYNGILVTNAPESECIKHNLPKWVRYMKREPVGFCTEPNGLAWCKNSGATAINLAYHLGASKVVLLGFDMKAGPKGERNYHPNQKNPDPPSKSLLQLHTSGFDALAKAIKDKGVQLEVVNATPNSALPTFPLVSFQETLK